MKRIFALLSVMVFFCGAAVLVYTEWNRCQVFSGADRVIAQLSQTSENTEGTNMQENLACWYNTNLYADFPDAGYREQYTQILDFADGAMGYITVPEQGLTIPLYHGTGKEIHRLGAGHVETTAFPLGNPGEHSAVQLPISLEVGSYFYVHILNRVIPYQIISSERMSGVSGGFPGESGESYCSLVYGEPDSGRLLLGKLCTSAPEEREISVQVQPDGWFPAACLVLVMGIFSVFSLMWCEFRP